MIIKYDKFYELIRAVIIDASEDRRHLKDLIAGHTERVTWKCRRMASFYLSWIENRNHREDEIKSLADEVYVHFTKKGERRDGMSIFEHAWRTYKAQHLFGVLYSRPNSAFMQYWLRSSLDPGGIKLQCKRSIWTSLGTGIRDGIKLGMFVKGEGAKKRLIGLPEWPPDRWNEPEPVDTSKYEFTDCSEDWTPKERLRDMLKFYERPLTQQQLSAPLERKFCAEMRLYVENPNSEKDQEESYGLEARLADLRYPMQAALELGKIEDFNREFNAQLSLEEKRVLCLSFVWEAGKLKVRTPAELGKMAGVDELRVNSKRLSIQRKFAVMAKKWLLEAIEPAILHENWLYQVKHYCEGRYHA